MNWCKTTQAHLLLSLLFLPGCSDVRVSSGDGFKKLTLPDNSVVYLNKNSVISYPKDFDTERIVELTGEAFFDVVTTDEQVFLVITEFGEIEVTGTRFNVKANRKSNEFEVEVDEGSVSVIFGKEIKQLGRGERISYNDGQLNKSRATREFTKWVNQLEKEVKKLQKDLEKDISRESKKAEKKIKKILN